VSVVLTAVGFLLPGAMEEPGTPVPAATWPITLVIVLLLVPVQAAAEEYIFRGYLMQSIGRWLRHPAFAILLPVPLFVLGHGYDLLGQIGVGLFAVAAGWLTWRTGGLEAAIALHVVNNLSAFLLSLVGVQPHPEHDGTGQLPRGRSC
jgi:membrane protease YdiL (CAAX protease family)